MARRLVVLGNTLTALAVCRDAHKRGFDAVLVDRSWGIAFNTRSAALVLLDAACPDGIACERICQLAQPGPAYLIATGDAWVRFVMAHRQRLDASFTRVLHAGNEALSICLNKSRFARWCRDNEVPAPRAWFPNDEPRPAELDLPLFLRPADTMHDRPRGGIPKAAEVSSEDALAQLLSRYAEADIEPLVTESLLGQHVVQYSVAVARNGQDSLSFVAIKARPAAEACSVGTYVELSPNAEIEASAVAALTKLDYFGIAEVEVLYSPRTGRHALIEINARPWLQYALAAASGHDFLAVLTGEARHEVPRKTRVAWLNWQDDLYVTWSRSVGMVRHRELGLRAYLASLLRARVYAVFDWRDLQPWWRRLLRLSGIRERQVRMRTAK
ncbi:MAG: hypothetical protein IT532_07085 [Burkholderiales bacterium]|nr:hypothetical protein [Burkholderiales bacterium]